MSSTIQVEHVVDAWYEPAKQGQQLALDGVAKLSEVLNRISGDRARRWLAEPFADRMLPRCTEAVDTCFDVAERILWNRRQLSHRFLDGLAGAPAGRRTAVITTASLKPAAKASAAAN